MVSLSEISGALALSSGLIGMVLTARLVKAHWAWSELTSPRFAKDYRNLGQDAVRLSDAANDGAPFASLSDIDIDVLVSLIEHRQPGFLQNIDDVSSFRCEGWSKEELLGSLTIETLGPDKRLSIDYWRFLRNPPHLVDGVPEWSDPRVAAESWPSDTPFVQREPAIAISVQGRRMLLDGYCRSVIFARHSAKQDIFLVWMPGDGRFAQKGS